MARKRMNLGRLASLSMRDSRTKAINSDLRAGNKRRKSSRGRRRDRSGRFA